MINPIHKFTHPIYDSLSSLLNSRQYHSFDNIFGQMCLIETNLDNELFGSICKMIHSNYYALLHESHNTKLLNLYFTYTNDKIDYRIIRIKIFDYALSSGIFELWKLITIYDLMIIDMNTSSFIRKYYFRIYQTNHRKSIKKLRSIIEKKLSYWPLTMMENCIEHFENNKLRFMYMLLKKAIEFRDIEVIELFTHDTVFHFDKYYIFDLLTKHVSFHFLTSKILRHTDNIFTKKCIVSISKRSSHNYRFIVFVKLFSKYNIINNIVFDANIIDHLIPNIQKYTEIIKIIIKIPGLNIPKKIFLSNNYIRSKIFSYRIMLPLFVLRGFLLPEICSIIMDLFLT